MIDAAEAEHSNSDSPVNIGRRAFDDLTDLQNDEFIVSTLHILWNMFVRIAHSNFFLSVCLLNLDQVSIYSRMNKAWILD